MERIDEAELALSPRTNLCSLLKYFSYLFLAKEV